MLWFSKHWKHILKKSIQQSTVDIVSVTVSMCMNSTIVTHSQITLWIRDFGSPAWTHTCIGLHRSVGNVRIRSSGGRRGWSGRRRERLLWWCVVCFILTVSRVGGRSFSRQQSFLLTLLLFHPAVLEPYFHLRLVELQRGRDLHAPRTGQVLVEVELFLQLGQLLRGEVGPDRVRLSAIAVLAWPTCRWNCNRQWTS